LGFPGRGGLWLLLLWPGFASGGPEGPRTVELDSSFRSDSLAGAVEIRPDPAGTGRIEDVAAANQGWGPPPRLERKPGFQTYWLRLRIESRLSGPADCVLLPAPLWQEVELYSPAASGAWNVVRSGSRTALADRPLPVATVALPLRIDPRGPSTYYLRLRADFGSYSPPHEVGAQLLTQRSFLQSDARSRQLAGIYAGVILAMVLYNAFLFVSVRERVYFLYVLYAGAFGSIWVVKAGLAFERLWPASPRWNEVATFYLIAAAVVCGNRFVQTFLDLQQQAPRIKQLLDAFSIAAGVAAALSVSAPWVAAEQLLAYTSLLTCFAYIAGGLQAVRRGSRPARIFLAAFSALIVGTIAYVLAYLDLLPRSFWTVNGVQLGSALEVVLLAFALGDRINRLRREKEEVEAQHRLGLEREVRERTQDLAHVNRRLQLANARLARISRQDELTGLANRRQLERVLDTEWRRCARTRQPLSLVLLDVDHFKDYNDEYGHLAGDRCLQQVAAALAERCYRAGDIVTRYGGEEFLAVLPGTDREGAASMAERFRQAVEELEVVHAAAAPSPLVTVSAGVGSVLPTDGGTSEDLLAEADAALYAAKRQGRNRVVSVPTPRPQKAG
jgi:diguanylate cyclase (GGDEF)-like protein